MRAKLFKLIAIFIAGTLFHGCGIRIPPIEQSGVILPQSEKEKVCSSLSSRAANLKTLKALYRTVIEYSKKRERIRQVYVFECPDKLRVELLSSTGSFSLGVLIAKDGKAQFIEGDSGKITNSDDVRELTGEILRFDAGPEDLANALVGLLPPNLGTFDQCVNSIITYDAKGSREIFSADSKFRAISSGESASLTKVQLFDERGKRVVMQVEYSDYKDFNGMSVPGLLKISLPKDRLTIELSLSFFSANSKAPEHVFEFLS